MTSSLLQDKLTNAQIYKRILCIIYLLNIRVTIKEKICPGYSLQFSTKKLSILATYFNDKKLFIFREFINNLKHDKKIHAFRER